MTSRQLDSQLLRPPVPVYVLRGHTAQVTAIVFADDHIISGDADGHVFCWSNLTRRAVRKWQAHTRSLLGLYYAEGVLFTHGRDNKVYMWQLPLVQEDAGDQKPWLLSALDVYALTFCSLSVVATQGKSSTVPSFLVAVPNHKHSESVDVYEMPSCQRIHAEICPTNDTKTGMVMTTCLSAAEASLCLVTGYDSGHVAVYTFTASGWVMDYIDQTHRAPVLSIACAWPTFAFSVGADARVARHPLLELDLGPMVINSGHNGQQAASVRSDGELFATGGFDGRARVYTTAELAQVCVLKWHTGSVNATAFASISEASAKYSGVGQVLKRRLQAVKREQHLFAVGGKDGSISLWDIF